MRSPLVALFFVLLCLNSFAQVGNEWIDFNQAYFKIPVAKEGIYKLTYSDLVAAGFPVSGTDATKIQLFHRGTEQPVFVEGEGDLQLDPTDFIEFYGRGNDGTLDAELYKPSSSQPHQYYNLYNDTTSYFLTVALTNGKRINSFYEDNNESLPAQSYHLEDRMLLLTNEYSTGADYGQIQNTFFDVGEGWMSGKIFQTQLADYTLTDIIQSVTAAGAPLLEVQIVGRGPMAHQVEIYVGAGLRLLSTHNFSGFEPQTISSMLQWNDIAADGKLTVRVKVNGVGGQPDRVSVSYIQLTYPQRLDAAAGEKVFTLPENAGGKSFIQIENPAPNLRLFDVTDPNSIIRIDGTLSATMDAIVPSTVTPRRIFATSTTYTPPIKRVLFRQITPSQHDYIIIGHPTLRRAALGYSDPIKAYAEYRASSAGGGYDTLVVDIQQLYDQFNYGETSPLGVYNFLEFLTNSNTPKYLLLVGKGLDVWYKYYRNPAGFSAFKDLVPSAGYPGADMAFSTGLAGTQYEPAIPTGRIPAMKSDEVAAYLNKVKEAEALPFNDLWRKNLLHLSGGREEGEPELLQSYLQDLQTVAEDLHLGGKVSALAKYSKDIQLVNVSKQVNDGVNLITFFGHSSATNLDFDIGYATNPVMGYNNKGKYPTLLMNGCNVGAYFLTYTTFGEDWVLARDKGATAFIAHSSYGFTSLLKRYADYFYEVGYQDSTFIYKGIGDIQKEIARQYMSTAVPTPSNTTQVQQMILLGDPAVKLFGAPKADLEINSDNISIESLDGEPITAMTESFALKLRVRNFGQAKPDTIRIEVTRVLQDNSTIVYDSLYPVTKYSDTLLFIIKKEREEGFGTNSFTVTIDPDNVLQEITKDNNTATKSFVIPLNGTKHLYPVDFGIINTTEVGLAFQTTDLLSEERDFLLELDTINTFDSPFKKQVTVKGKVLVRQSMALLALDTMAYYWRTKLAQPLANESTEWTVSSFTFINEGPEGWAQVHFPQYLENETLGLVKDAVSRQLTFKETVTALDITTFGANHPALNTDVSIKINGEEYNLTQQGFICRDNSINLVAFDKNSATPYIGVKFKWYNRANRACGREPWVINNYVPADMVTGDGFDIIQFVDNVQPGDSVVLFSIGDAQYASWPLAAKTKLGELGLSVAQIDGLAPGEPVVILGRKGLAPGGAIIERTTNSPADLQVLDVSKTITGRYSSGTMSSGVIGPAINWQSLYTRYSDVEVNDIISFDVVGVRMNGEEELILSDVSGYQDLATIEATEFPYLKIVFKITDDLNLTAAQLNQWIVAYTPVPDGLLIFRGPVEQQVVNEGETVSASYGFINISDKTFSDSLSVQTEIFNQTFRSSVMDVIKIRAPLPGDTTKFNVHVPTTDRRGLNDVNVIVNPRVFPEQYFDNNVLQLHDYILVEEETIHPVLDVSIDGRYIENRDFVTSNPFILIKVWDENKHILKTDTSGMRVLLSFPCDLEPCELVPISLTSPEISWFPATTTSPFRIEFRPSNLINGVYTLRVEAEDGSSNPSGNEPYEIQFTVNDETSVTINDPYPNPFTSHVYFKIVIAGNEAPDAFDMRLISVNGKQVAYYADYDHSTLHVGTNLISWDGKDTSGNPLSSGVYVYKMMIYIRENVVEKTGKIVLVRNP
jgi:hypothetical protein